MEEGTGEHHGAARRSLVTAGAVFRKTHLAALKLRIEIDRNRKTSMCGSLGRVVPVRAEVAAVLRRVAGHDVALHACRLEEMHLLNLRIDPPDNAVLHFDDQVLI